MLAECGVRIVQLVTDDLDAARCPDCRELSTSAKEWALTRPKDLPCGGGPVLLQVAQAAVALPDVGLSGADAH